MYGQWQLAYAPTPYSYTPTSNISATINLDEVSQPQPSPRCTRQSLTLLSQEVKLSASSAERDLYESLAEVYSIIITLDALEKAYLKDSIAEGDYTETCSRLLKQYKSNLQEANVANAFVDLETFKQDWEVRNTSPEGIIWRYV